MFYKILKKISLCLSVFFISLSVANIGLGYEFRKDSEKISSFLQAKNQLEKARITILFDDTYRENIRNKFDLVEVKASLINGLAEYLAITDPFLVNDYLINNKLSAQEVLHNQNLRQDALNQFKNNYFLTIIISSVDRNNMMVKYSLFDKNKSPEIAFTSLHAIDSKLARFEKTVGDKVTTSIKSTNKAIGAFVDDYYFNSDNYSVGPWSYYHPSAFLNNAKGFHLTGSFWLKDITTADISLNNLRLDYRFPKFDIAQLSVASNGSSLGHFHSGYAYGKVNLVNQENSGVPLFLSLGMKARFYWNNDENDEFKNTAESSKNLDQLSFYLAINYYISPLHLVVGGYLDNLYSGIDLDWFALDNMVVSSHIWLPRVNEEGEESGNKSADQPVKYFDVDWALAVSYAATDYFSMNLSHQHRPNKFSIGFKFHI